jgi:hypothetical protein
LPAGSVRFLVREWIQRMMELTVTLGFVCCHCEGWISATLHCEGKGLQPRDGSIPVAAALVSCPCCERTIRVIFEPFSGTVHCVEHVPVPKTTPMPSAN